ncbi:hypothetical protein CR162_19830 [Pseudoroseomonas rhizosphaerae]|uniref:Polysaccharide pyruvyl transferase domain-containing protein n=1 Tax=Teichococcus rhizosphaerae TaxID=1335062 RepID=A0A2C7A4C6_9PROT|nr:hypothetical protein [Pseudoroseomonas rhizosphaerae]PHK93200.1 hypothetical protein CR162_19830 [Pseudoroseomonas rhizosphaerae]
MILFANHRRTKNVGDLACTPYEYFGFPDKKLTDISGELPEAHAVVLGGGAIEYMMAGKQAVQQRAKARHKVAWGIGASQHGSSCHPAPPSGFDLLGLREFGREGGIYVPCASCMADFFDSVPPAETEIVTFFNADPRISRPELPDFPAMTNESSLEGTLAFLARGEVVMTNSYHGAYWASLMGRKVVCFPYSSKFHGYKCPPAMATVETWKEVLPRARAYSDYLDDCRYENLKFFRRVADLIY